MARFVTFLNQFMFTVRHVPGSKNALNLYTDANEAIVAFPHRGGIPAVNYVDLDHSCPNTKQTKVHFRSTPQVVLSA